MYKIKCLWEQKTRENNCKNCPLFNDGYISNCDMMSKEDFEKTFELLKNFLDKIK